MRNKTILAIVGCCLLSTTFFTQKEIAPEVNFYDVTFLRNSPAVEKVLKETHGFVEVNYETKDNFTINSIMLDKSNKCNVKATVISCPGFVPGRKEGMATLYAMLEKKPYNFIFIDSRGHGKSDGELLTFNGIKHYGESQYLDMVATIQYIAHYNKKHNISPDIIIHGLCSGALHTVKAVAHLKEHDTETYNCIKGIILDSGWPSISDIVETIIDSESISRCKTYNLPFLQPLVARLTMATYNTYFKEQHKTQRPITEIINNIDQPIFFIHAENDSFVPIHNVYPLIATAKNPTSWFIKESSHVNNHLKYKEEYAYHMEQFIQSAL